jgi:hypothetical protein
MTASHPHPLRVMTPAVTCSEPVTGGGSPADPTPIRRPDHRCVHAGLEIGWEGTVDDWIEC